MSRARAILRRSERAERGDLERKADAIALEQSCSTEMNKLGNRRPQQHLIYICVAGVMVSHKSHGKRTGVKEK